MPAGYNYTVRFYVSTNEGGGLVSYITGKLIYNRNAGTLTGLGTQYFSNRTWSDDKIAPNGYRYGDQPFAPDKTDDVLLTLNVNDGSATFTLPSQGNAIYPITWHEVIEDAMCITGKSSATTNAISFTTDQSQSIH